MSHINGVVKLLEVPVHRRRGFTQNDANFLQEFPADGELPGAAASDRGDPETRPGRIPFTDRLGVATAPHDVQQRLKHDWPLASPWLGQQTNQIREPNISLSHNENQILDRLTGQSLELQKRPTVSFGTQQCIQTGQRPVRDGRATVLILGGFRTTSVEGLVQTR